MISAEAQGVVDCQKSKEQKCADQAVPTAKKREQAAKRSGRKGDKGRRGDTKIPFSVGVLLCFHLLELDRLGADGWRSQLEACREVGTLPEKVKLFFRR